MARLSKAALAALAALVLAGPALADEVTLLAFGDSLTAGYGLEQGQGFTAQLESWLRDHGDQVVVINAGLSGDTTAGGAARLGWSLSDDVDAVIVALGGNDLLRGVAPEQTRANLASILEQIAARGLPVLLVGQRAPGNFGAQYKAAFDALYPDLAQAYGVALFPSFLQGLEDQGDRARVLREFMQADGLHPNAAGVALIVARMGPAVHALVEAAQAQK